MHPWHKQKGMGMARWRRKSPATILLALILSFAQVQFALAAIVNTVTVTGSHNALPVTDTAVETVDVADAAPGLNVTKTGTLNDDDGTAGISAGDTISYEVLADNTGNVSLTNITATDPLVTLTFDPTSDLDSDGELDVDETWRWTASYVLTATDISTNGGGDGDIDNTVTIGSDELPDEPGTVEVPISVTPAMDITKVATLNDDDGTPGQSADDTIDYVITVTNSGNTPISTLVVSDPLLPALTFTGTDTGSDGILEVGESWTYGGSYTLTQNDLDTNGGGDGLIENTVTVSSDQLPDQTADADVPIVQNPLVSLAKIADASGTNSAGDPINYTVTATNTGNVTLNNVVVSDPQLTPNTFTCVTLAPAATCELTGAYTTVVGDFTVGSFTNNASVTTDEGVGDTATTTTPLVLGASLSITKSASPSVVANPGDPVTYSVTVLNDGNVPLTGITVSDPMLTLDCGTGTAVIANLAIGASQTCVGTYNVSQADFDAGPTLLNTARADDDGTFGVSDTADETITLTQSPAFTVSKSGVLNDDDGIGGVSAGDTILYTVLVTNTGNIPLSGVAWNDPMATLTLASGDLDSDNLLDVGEVWELTGSYSLTQTDIDTLGGGDGNIENTVTISTNELPDDSASADVPLNINPSMEIEKVGVLNDDDGTPGLTAGDTATYTVTVTNTGNIRLTNLAVSDPLVTLTGPTGDTNGDNRLDTTEVWTYTGSTIITQVDLDTLGGGDGDIDNTVTVNSDQLPPQDASHELPLAPVSSMEIKKISTTPVRVFPTVYEFDYQITVRNTGAVTQTNIRVDDDLVAAIAPAVLAASPVVTVSGFAGTGGYNAGYDGSSDIALLAGDVQLAPGDIAVITITVRMDTSAQSISGLNTALASSDQITTPIPSDDPVQTPGDVGDVNPTPVDLPDTDGDGSPDDDETPGGDRDGDGIANSVDYDPTGYLYCQADGRILSGGLLTVENLGTGLSQTGVGTSNGIRIIRDGSDGEYQFHALQAGRYQISFSPLPTTGVPSTSLTSSGSFDVSVSPDDPVVIGSGEFASTGNLADFTEAANPFYTVFEIEEGDPAVFNNNIPFQFCGTPTISTSKSVVSGPDVQGDLSFNVTYRVSVEATGNEQVNDVQMTDDLDAVFGAGNYSVTNLITEAAPVGFTAIPDPFFNGGSNTALLSAGGILQPGETVSLLLSINVSVADGVYNNVLSGSGTSPLTGDPVPTITDDADITITSPNDLLLVEKTATPGESPLGGPISYTITFTNSGDIDLAGILLNDLLPNGMSYVADSALVDGVAIEPTITAARRIVGQHTSILGGHDNLPASGTQLVWGPVDIPIGGSVTITLVAVINASAADDEFVNLAFATNAATDAILSNIAKAKVRLEIEPVFQCSDLIGRVFDDLDKDGYADDGEPGLPGVRLATPTGLLVVTDKFGRYSIACGAIPDEDIGSNFILKLDTRTLPTGYRVTSENPRVVRLTRGKLTKLNFAAANLRIVRLELNDASFNGSSLGLTGETLTALGGLLGVLDEEPSILRIIYRGGENRGLSRERVKAVESLLKDAWDPNSRMNALSIETRLID